MILPFEELVKMEKKHSKSFKKLKNKEKTGKISIENWRELKEERREIKTESEGVLEEDLGSNKEEVQGHKEGTELSDNISNKEEMKDPVHDVEVPEQEKEESKKEESEEKQTEVKSENRSGIKSKMIKTKSEEVMGVVVQSEVQEVSKSDEGSSKEEEKGDSSEKVEGLIIEEDKKGEIMEKSMAEDKECAADVKVHEKVIDPTENHEEVCNQNDPKSIKQSSEKKEKIIEETIEEKKIEIDQKNKNIENVEIDPTQIISDKKKKSSKKKESQNPQQNTSNPLQIEKENTQVSSKKESILSEKQKKAPSLPQIQTPANDSKVFPLLLNSSPKKMQSIREIKDKKPESQKSKKKNKSEKNETLLSPNKEEKQKQNNIKKPESLKSKNLQKKLDTIPPQDSLQQIKEQRVIDLIQKQTPDPPSMASPNLQQTINLESEKEVNMIYSPINRPYSGPPRPVNPKTTQMFVSKIIPSLSPNVQNDQFNRPLRRRSSSKLNQNVLVYSAVSPKDRVSEDSSMQQLNQRNSSFVTNHSFHLSRNLNQKSKHSLIKSLNRTSLSPAPLNTGDGFSDISSHQSFNVRGSGYRRVRRLSSGKNSVSRGFNVPRVRRSGQFNVPRPRSRSKQSPQIIETVNTEPSNIPDLVIPENEEEFRLPSSVLQPFKSSYNVDDHKNTISIAKRLKDKGSNPFRFREVKGLFGGFSHKDNKRFPQAKRFLLKSLRLLQRKQNRQFMSCGARSVCIDLRDNQSIIETKGFLRGPKASTFIPGKVYDLNGDGRAKEVMSCLDDGGRAWNRGRLGNAKSRFVISLEGIESVKKSEHVKDDIALGKREYQSFLNSHKKEEIKEDVVPSRKVVSDQLNAVSGVGGSFLKEEATRPKLSFFSDSKNNKKSKKASIAGRLDKSLLNIDLVEAGEDWPMKILPESFMEKIVGQKAQGAEIDSKDQASVQKEPNAACIDLN